MELRQSRGGLWQQKFRQHTPLADISRLLLENKQPTLSLT